MRKIFFLLSITLFFSQNVQSATAGMLSANVIDSPSFLKTIQDGFSVCLNVVFNKDSELRASLVEDGVLLVGGESLSESEARAKVYHHFIQALFTESTAQFLKNSLSFDQKTIFDVLLRYQALAQERALVVLTPLVQKQFSGFLFFHKDVAATGGGAIDFLLQDMTSKAAADLEAEVARGAGPLKRMCHAVKRSLIR